MSFVALYGYRCDLTRDAGRQFEDLEALAAGKYRDAELYVDERSDRNPGRPAYGRLLLDLRAGRIVRLVVWRLDCLGLGLGGLAELWQELAALGVHFEALAESIDLTPAELATLPPLLNSLAWAHRRLSGRCVAAGQARAKARGQRWWPRRKGALQYLSEETVAKVLAFADAGRPVAAIAVATGVTRPTVYRLLRQHGRRKARR